MTGTFDDWRKTVKLEHEDGVFKKTVELPKVHTQYKVRATPTHPQIGCRLQSLAQTLLTLLLSLSSTVTGVPTTLRAQRTMATASSTMSSIPKTLSTKSPSTPFPLPHPSPQRLR